MKALDGHIAVESRRFQEVLRDADPASRVPSCPDWSVDDLLWHLAEVQLFWAEVVERRLQEPEQAEAAKPERPTDHADLVTLVEQATQKLLDSLAATPDSEPVWTWAQERTAGFVRRRQAHEALVHRVDAELAAGQRTPMDPTLATDGVDEALCVMFGGIPGWATFTADPGVIRLHTTDTGTGWDVTTGRFRGSSPHSGTTYDEPALVDVETEGDVAGEGGPVAVVTASAGDLDLWLWGRVADDVLVVDGDRRAVERLKAVVAEGIE